jgi:hypothetical protein
VYGQLRTCRRLTRTLQQPISDTLPEGLPNTPGFRLPLER